MAARKSIFAGFFCFLLAGITYTQLMSRMPAIKAQTGIEDADVGFALMCMGGGSLVGFLTINILLRNLQVRSILKAAALSFILIGLLLCFAHSKLQLFMLFALWGYGCAYLDVSMNTHALYVEMAAQRPYMSSMHAGYSVGCLIGSGLGSLFAFLNIALWLNFVEVGAVLIGGFVYLSGALLPDPPSVRERSGARDASAEKQHASSAYRILPPFIILCGLMGMFSYTAEGSVAEWGSLVLHETKHASEGVAALAYGVFSLFMAATRFGCDHVRARSGDRALLLCGTSLAFIGLLMVLLIPYALWCLIGYALMGIGLAPVFPIVVSNAGRCRGVSPKTATAVVSFVGYSGLLVIPPSLGFLAQHFGLERALLLPLGAILLVLGGSFAFPTRRPLRKVTV